MQKSRTHRVFQAHFYPRAISPAFMVPFAPNWHVPTYHYMVIKTRSAARQEPPAQSDTARDGDTTRDRGWYHDVPSAASWFDPVRELVLKLILKTSPALNLRLRKLCGPFEAAATGLAHLVSVTVTVDFMTVCVPALTVIASVAFAQQLLLLFSLVLLCCNLAKNALRLPRPVRPGGRQSRPLAELEQSYGFPSLHAAAALAIPMLAVSPTSPLVAALPEARLPGARAAALGWALGLLVWRQFDAALASGALEAAMASPWLAPCAAPLVLLLALCLPKGRALPGKAGATDTTVLEGVINLGCTLGALAHTPTRALEPQPEPWAER